jgi:hypothetical protein
MVGCERNIRTNLESHNNDWQGLHLSNCRENVISQVRLLDKNLPTFPGVGRGVLLTDGTTANVLVEMTIGGNLTAVDFAQATVADNVFSARRMANRRLPIPTQEIRDSGCGHIFLGHTTSGTPRTCL